MKNTLPNSITTTLICMIMALWCSIISGDAAAKRFATGLALEARERILELEQLVGFDHRRGTIRKPYSESNFRTLLDESHESRVEVAFWSLMLLSEMIEQIEIPDAVLKQAAERFIREFPNWDIETDEVASNMKRYVVLVLWQIKAETIPTLEDRVRYLETSIEEYARVDRRITNKAIDRLVEIGTEDAKSVILDNLKNSRRLLIGPDVQETLSIGLKKIALLDELDGLQKSDAVRILRRSLSQQFQQHGYTNFRYSVWLIRKLIGVGHPSSTELLLQIMSDKSINSSYRYEAQEGLIETGQISPDQRTIIYAD